MSPQNLIICSPNNGTGKNAANKYAANVCSLTTYILLGCIFLFCSPISAWARVNVAALKQEYGNNYQSVPYYLRFKFLNENGIGWPNASFEEREKFLIEYQEQTLKEQKDLSEKKKIESRIERDKQRLKQEKLRAAQQKARDKERKKREELRLEQQKKRHFQQKINEMKKEERQLLKQRH